MNFAMGQPREQEGGALTVSIPLGGKVPGGDIPAYSNEL